MMTRKDSDEVAEMVLSAYCRTLECATPADIVNACELLISKAALAIDKYTPPGVAGQVLVRTMNNPNLKR